MKKVISIILAVFLIFNQTVAVGVVYSAPDRPETPTFDFDSDDAEKLERPERPDSPDNVKPAEEVVAEEAVKGDEEIDENEANVVNEQVDPIDEEYSNKDNEVESPEKPRMPHEEDKAEQYTGDKSEDNVVGGEVEIDTGDANGSGSIANVGNENVSVNPKIKSGIGGAVIVNDGNGADSDNSASVALADTSETEQDNNAQLDNSLRIDTNSGSNSTSGNTNADSKIETGDANATGTIFNSVNTNVDGLVVSEFNVVDDHTGDYVLDFEAGCILGCENFGGVSAGNIGNGSDSDNTIALALLDENATFQNNDADINNQLILSANSGDNKSNDNTGGNSSIQTGDANVAGNVLNFANNNFAGNVVYGVVNIFGDLIGDIIIPEEVLTALGYSGGVDAGNIGNGSESVNLVDLDVATIDEFSQFNNAEIINNLNIEAETGGNKSNNNTGGDSSIKTGDSSVDAQVVNIANNNIVGGNWWIVLVNEAGNWVGKLIGLPGSTVAGNYAASEGTNFQTNSNGDIDISNQGNGSGSENVADVVTANTNITTQTNNALIVNDINLSAITGENSASNNTNGDSSIETGDANVMLNLVNFVNNNFAGGNVFLTVVNVFGSFIGDIVTPGAEKESVADSEENNDNNHDKGGIGGVADIGENVENGNNNVEGENTHTDTAFNGNSGDSGAVLLAQAGGKYPVSKLGGKSGEALALGESSEELGEITSGVSSLQNDSTRINLAWLALLLPPMGIYILVKNIGVLALVVEKLRGGR